MNGKLFVSNKDETTRMFKSGFVEFFSKTHWTVPIIVYLPLCLFLVYFGLSRGVGAWNSIWLFPAGMFVWTFTEYALHRFVFHYEPKSKIGQKLHWTLHGVHHDYPQDSLRLVMPPGLSLPLAGVFYLIFLAVIGSPHVYPFFSGFLTGYLFYDIGHYAIHHFAMKGTFLLTLKKHHMKHHYSDPHQGYGVSSPLWDYVFRTKKLK